MKPWIRITVMGTVLLKLVTLFASPALACPSGSHFDELLKHNKLDELKALHADIQACKGDTYHFFNFYIAHALYKDIFEKKLTGKDQVAKLEEIYALNEQHWPTLYSLAVAAEEVVSLQTLKKSYEFYFNTLRTIDNRSHTPERDVPEPAFIQELQEKVSLLENTLKVLDKDTPLIDSSRSGNYKVVTRGIQATVTHHPIRFAYKSTKLQGNDLENTKLLFEQLKPQSPDITIIGHTDQVGSQTYNLELSKNRANAVKDFLSEHGYTGRIHVLGKGKDEPLPLSASYAAALSEQEKHQLNRRVEIQYSW